MSRQRRESIGTVESRGNNKKGTQPSFVERNLLLAVYGRIPDRRLVRMYQAADVYAFPTLIENFPIVQLESLAAKSACFD